MQQAIMKINQGGNYMVNNSNLSKARMSKNDEFYTMIDTIEKELTYYKKHLKNKIVLCNCDDPKSSAFWKYLHLNFSELELKKLVSTYYNEKGVAFKTEYTGGDDNNIENGIKIQLKGNGDFRSEECLNILDECDVVITNPPFSLFRDFVDVLMEHKKKFLILGNLNAIAYKQIFTFIKDNLLWLGVSIHSGGIKFYIPKDYPISTKNWGKDETGRIFVEVGGIRWFTNLEHDFRLKSKLVLHEHYTTEKYPKYDNYNAINVNKVAEIPIDYDGAMGVPITFMDKYNSEQFEILGIATTWDKSNEVQSIRIPYKGRLEASINGKQLYKRILIRKK